MTKKKATKSKLETPSTTVLSVQFAEEELERIKEAAAIPEQPPASWVRQAAVGASIQTINASQTPTQQRAIADLSKQIAHHLLKGDVLIGDVIDEGPELGWQQRRSASYTEGGGYLEVEAAPIDDRTKRNLLRALEYAAGPFATSLIDAIVQLQTSEEEKDFIPVITRESDD